MKLNLVIEDKLKKLDQRRVKKAVKSVLKQFKLSGQIEVSISLVAEKEMAKLNQQYMGKIGPTDVLSFPLEKEIGPDKVIRLGDVVVCYQVAERQAREKGMEVEAEIDFLIKHGMLHLLGIHHD